MSRERVEWLDDEPFPRERPFMEWTAHLVVVACWLAIVILTFLGFAPRAAGADNAPRRAHVERVVRGSADVLLDVEVARNESLSRGRPGRLA